MALVLWKPEDGAILTDAPLAPSPLRVERFSEQIEAAYWSRYKGLPPHVD
jgi:hypothetical protein